MCTESGTLRPCVIHTTYTATPHTMTGTELSSFMSMLSAARAHPAPEGGTKGYSIPYGSGFHWNHIATEKPHAAKRTDTPRLSGDLIEPLLE